MVVEDVVVEWWVFFFFFDVVDKGVEFVESFFYDLIIFEGSGVMFLVYRIDVYIFIIGGR